MKQLQKQPFDSAREVWDIRYRLAPIDVGFDLRVQNMPVVVDPADDPIRVSYADNDGERCVTKGPQPEVLNYLRELGYTFTV